MTLAEPAIAPGDLADLALHGDRPALVTNGDVITYRQLDARVGEVAERLGPSPRLIALEAAPEPASIAAYLAARRAGQPVLLLAPGADTSTRRLVDAYDPDVVIGADTNWGPDERRRRSSHVLHPDLALLVSTSGSTGSPKVVRLSAASVQANAESIAAYLQLTPEDRAITSLPLHYCYGLSVLNSHLAVGASITLSGLSVVDPCFWELFRTSGVTSLAGVPYTFELLDRVGFDSMRLPSLRFVTQAGGRLPAEAVRRFAELGRRDGWELFVMYGQTEATARMAYLPPEFAVSHPHAIGVPIPGGELDIDPVRDDPDHGELVYRGPNVMLGYATGPADLANGRVVHELRTGDLARRAPDGIFEITGRRSRFIKPFGVRVDLDHLEAHLGEAGVTALCAGDDSGIAAAVTSVAQRDVAARLIVDHTRLPLRCVAVAVVEELPRLPNGKPDHTAVLAAAERSVPSPPPTGDTLAERLVSAYTAVLGGPVSAEDSFVSAGGDSLSYVELSVHLEEILGTLPPAWHLQLIRDLHAAPRPSRRMHRVETTVALRAAAIVLIVGTHTKAWHLAGGAHLLLGIAGYNFARFQLATGGAWRSARRVALPTMCWLAAVAATSDQFAWPHALLLNSIIGRPDARWAYWFAEALVQILLVTGAVLAVPAVRRAERRAPFLAALVVTAGALLVRFDLVDLGGQGHRISRGQEVAWLFGLGWAAALADTRRRRLLVSVLVAGAVPGFFHNPQREAFIVAALLATIWVPTVVIPAPLHSVAGRVASASLWIYLCHWQLFPPIDRTAGPYAATAASIVGGVVAWRAYTSAERVVAAGIVWLRNAGVPWLRRARRRRDVPVMAVGGS